MKPSVIAISENGKFNCGLLFSYGGLTSVAYRLANRAIDSNGTRLQLFERLESVNMLSYEQWADIVEHGDNSSDYYSFIHINADLNNVYAVETELDGSLSTYSFPLDTVLEFAYIDKETFYRNLIGECPDALKEKI